MPCASTSLQTQGLHLVVKNPFGGDSGSVLQGFQSVVHALTIRAARFEIRSAWIDHP
jgi:hypothetical protein